MKFCIQKRSRFSETPSPYRGPACEVAGVEPRWYTSMQDAKMDIEKLNAVNPVGFEVVSVTEAFHAQLKD